MAIGLKPLNADRQILNIMNAKYEVVNIEIQGKSKTVRFADVYIFNSYYAWLRFLATIRQFGYKVNAVQMQSSKMNINFKKYNHEREFSKRVKKYL